MPTNNSEADNDPQVTDAVLRMQALRNILEETQVRPSGSTCPIRSTRTWGETRRGTEIQNTETDYYDYRDSETTFSGGHFTDLPTPSAYPGTLLRTAVSRARRVLR